MADDPHGGRWMTYADLAVARGTSRASAERFARRKRWQRQAGNDGHARVFVPMTYADNARTSSRDEVADGPGGDPHGSISALKSAIDVLRHQLVRADARSDKAEAERDQANAKAAEALGRLAELEAALQTARSGGRWRRAWRGWRG